MKQTHLVPIRAEITDRIERLQELINRFQLDAVWISHHVNMFYFSNTAQNGHLLVPGSGPPVLYIKRYLPRARLESPIDTIHPLKNLFQIHDDLVKIGIRRIGYEGDVLPVSQFLRYQEVFKSSEFHDFSTELRRLRSIKSDYEMEWIKCAAAQLDSVFERIGEWLKEGISELELASLIEGFLRRIGHQGHLPMRSFNGYIHYGNILFGASGAVRGCFDGPTNGPGLSAAIPGGPGNAVLSPGQPVFIDLVSGCAGYMADATRVFSLGDLPDQLMSAHEICLRIQQTVIETWRPDISGATLYETALSMLKDKELASFFMGPPDDQVPFIAHGFGLEIDEFPLIARRYDYPVPVGSVLALEPKMVFPGLGAVGIENSWVFENRGPRRLTLFPDEINKVK